MSDGLSIFPSRTRLKSRETFIKCSSKAETSKLLFLLSSSNLRWKSWHMCEWMEIEKLDVFRLRCGWVGGVERRGETFITDITDLTDRPSGNPRMDVRDITAITPNMISYDVI